MARFGLACLVCCSFRCGLELVELVELEPDDVDPELVEDDELLALVVGTVAVLIINSSVVNLMTDVLLLNIDE